MGTEEERRARVENDAATKWLRFAMETDEERKAKLEKMATAKQLRLAVETKKSKTMNMVATTTAQVGLGDRGRKKSKKKLDLI